MLGWVKGKSGRSWCKRGDFLEKLNLNTLKVTSGFFFFPGVWYKFMLSFVKTTNFKANMDSNCRELPFLIRKAETFRWNSKLYGCCVCWFSALLFCLHSSLLKICLPTLLPFASGENAGISVYLKVPQNYWACNFCRSNDRYSVFMLIGFSFTRCILHQLHTLEGNLSLVRIPSENCVCMC